MNYAQKIKQKLIDGETIYAVIYARVSTDNEGQKDSCDNQVSLADNYVNKHQNIKVVGIYIDDGISGKNDFNRPDYQNMLNLIAGGTIDLVLTKAMDRLNRDQLNSLQLTNFLINTQTTVLTLDNEEIQDFEDFSAQLVQSINYTFDAQYVKKQSINGKKVQELRCQRKELTAKDISYGYVWNKEDKTISINTHEAEIVTRIFEEYVYRNQTPATIRKDLRAKGINICAKTISNILNDTRYIGIFYINKRSSKLGTGQTKTKRFNLPKDQWIPVDVPDLAIIDRDLYDMAQKIRESRKQTSQKNKRKQQAYFQGKHEYAGKIFCPICGKPYQFRFADRYKKYPIYHQAHEVGCTNKVTRIGEKELEDITRQTLRKIMEKQTTVYKSLEIILSDCVKNSQNSNNEIEKLRKQRTVLEQKIDTLIETLTEDGLTITSKEKIKAKINKATEDLENLSKEITSKEDINIDTSYIPRKIAEIKKAIEELKNFRTIDRNRVQNYIERIELQPTGDITIVLKTGQIINVTQQQKDFSKEDNVVRMRRQGGLYSLHLT